MKRRLKYTNAPITEAIIDLRVTPRDDLTMEVLKGLCDVVTAEYPETEPTFEAMGTLEIKPGISASASAHQEQTGFRSISSDRKTVCQRKINGFTFSRLAPYESWIPFRDQGRSLWNLYRDATMPGCVRRLAVRYVNRIEIPHATVDLKDYFRTSPEISPELPQILGGFFMQLRIPQPDINATAILNQTIVPSRNIDSLSVILDIDIFRDDAVPTDEDSVWAYFETLHARKNDIFEACITDRTRELFV